MDKHLEAAALVALAKANIPTDIQELLISGDPMRGIPPGALRSAMQNVFASLTAEAPEVVARLNSPLSCTAKIETKPLRLPQEVNHDLQTASMD